MVTAAVVTVNGTPYAVSSAYVGTTLSEFLRKNLLLTGTKVFCREGGCGVCVVYVEHPDPANPEVTVKRSINSCLCPVLSCDGWSITTVEGTGSRNAPSQIQQQLTKHYGTQCGYCTTGMIMNMHGLGKKYPGKDLTQQIVEDSFDGNMCRCTGYRPILDAFKTFGSDSGPDCRVVLDVEDVGLTDANPAVCPSTGLTCLGTCAKKTVGQIAIPNSPTALTDSAEWYQPHSLAELYTLMATTARQKVFYVAGHTSIGVYDDGPYDVEINMRQVPELHIKTSTSDSVMLGASVTLTDVIDFFDQTAASASQFGYLNVLAAHIKRIAGTPVRNAATWAGSFMMKKAHLDFPSDTFLCFELAQTQITIDNGVPGGRAVVSPLQFLTTDMANPPKIILSASFPTYTPDFMFRSYKIMPRSQNAHALVNAGFRAQIDRTSQPGKFIVVETPALIFGNISDCFNHAILTEAYLTGKNIGDPEILKSALAILAKEIVPASVLGEASPAYKNSLACGLFYKFALEIVGDSANSRFRSAVGSLIRPLSSGVQSYPTNEKNYPVTQPIPKLESLIQCTGEAKYVSDQDSGTMLYAAFAVAERGNADIAKIDSSHTMLVPGVLRVITAMDIPGVNNFNPPSVQPEELLATKTALFAGQPVAVIVASSQQAAELGAKLLKVTYTNIKAPVLSCQDAIAAKSFFPEIEDFVIGDAPGAVKDPYRVQGSLEIGSQMHFHMETQVAVCTPTEDGLDVEAGTQWVDSVQDGIAQCLGMKKNAVNVSVKRVGGAFGAKITRSNIVASGASLAAHIMNRPVKMFMSLWDNAKIVGKRNPYFTKYDVGFDKNGKLTGIIMDVYVNCGAQANDTPIVAIPGFGDNVYMCPNWKVSMTNCKTNLPANTWTRAPGSTEAIFFIEYIMEHIAQFLNKSPLEVKRANYYKNGDQTITGQILTDCTIDKLTEQFLASSEYTRRLQDVTAFNRDNRWRKRGISITPMKYGSMWNGNMFNCHIAIFHNGGTVAVSHGGSEIGQGINTKVAQAVAYALGVPLDMVSIKPNFSLTNANATSTGGSMTSELVCMAALDACKQLTTRIGPVRAKMPKASWTDLMEKCFTDGVDMTARSWVVPHTADQVSYNTYGLTCTEVELDVLTGENQITRFDVVHDCGESISPLVDIGQIEGAVIMGLGYYTSEEIVHDPATGQLVTYSTWKYKPPTTKDIPIDFRVEILKNASNPSGVLRSKLVAEPPLCMTCSVVFALREACKAAREEISPQKDWFRIDAPMTVEKVQQYCLPDIGQFKYT